LLSKTGQRRLIESDPLTMEHRAITRVKAFVPGPSASSPELTALGPFVLALPYNARLHGTWATLFFCANFHWEAEARRATISGRHTPGPTKTVGSFPPRLLPKGFSPRLGQSECQEDSWQKFWAWLGRSREQSGNCKPEPAGRACIRPHIRRVACQPGSIFHTVVFSFPDSAEGGIYRAG
jgi:hypothetical protein